jgi:folate-binding protein YgfZ
MEPMTEGSIATLARRGVVAVGGADALKFLNDLVTNDLEQVVAGRAGYGGLLTPQGKILFDFLVFAEDGRFVFDLPRAAAADFAKRLGFYRLRAKVEIADLSAERTVYAAWGGGRPAIAGAAAEDPRLPALGWRGIAAAGATVADAGFGPASEADYDAHRIALGVPEGGIDFAYGEGFPHDADMDQLGGVAFKKGCYVGQEVVSRMEHRGTARRRFVTASADGPLPVAGTAILAGDKPVGTLGSAAGSRGLALVRIDRVRDALDGGVPITAGGAPVSLALPGWARFGWTAGVAED